MSSRRQFLWTAFAATSRALAADPLVSGVETAVLWPGRGKGPGWFHPRACRQPGGLFMTCQTISGSDLFGPVHWSESRDAGRTWTGPALVPGLGRIKLPGGIEEGVCDVVPDYHAATGTLLAMGWNVYYKDNRLTQPNEERWPVYSVRSRDGKWGPRRKLEWNHPEATAIYGSNCSQRVMLDDGRILLPLTFGRYGRMDRSVTTALCSFDGERVRILASGTILRLAEKRGLLEPSVVRYGGRFFMTIRAEDERGYVTASAEGLDWRPIQPWRWDDGEPITMSSTQQHWMPHSEALFLVYTRKAEGNVNVMRWRAPLWMARVDPDTMRLIRETEQVVIPMSGDGVRQPDSVARLGNFHTVAASASESLVTVGENLPSGGFSGDTLIARVRWSQPNRVSP